MNEEVLTKPTVGDVIRQLSKYDPSVPFVICDADTNYTIEIIHFDNYDDYISLSGLYSEMDKSR